MSGPSLCAVPFTGPPDFEVVVRPLVECAAERLRSAAGESLRLLAPAALAALEQGLADELAWLCTPTLRAESAARLALHPAGPGAARDAAAPLLRHGGVEAVLARSPVLARLVSAAAERWVHAAGEMLHRLDADGALLDDHFAARSGRGRVVALRTRLSDPHRGGRTAAWLRFAGGAEVVYKPRSVAMEAGFHDLLRWLDAVGVRPTLRALRVVERGSHGWMEFARPAPCASAAAVERFHRRAGMLLALAYALGAGDLHADNVVACGEHPVLVDLEVLLATPCALVPHADAGGAGDALWESVLRTGLLPAWTPVPGGGARHEGGLASAPADGGDGRGGTALPGVAFNLPRWGGRAHPAAEHPAALAAGFERMHATLREHRDALLAPGGPLAALSEGETRMVLRGTRVYTAMLRRLTAPPRLRDAAAFRAETERLRAPLRACAAPPPLRAAFDAEQRDLAALDVPRFTVAARGREVADAWGDPVGRLPGDDGWTRTVARLRRMDAADAAVQLRLVRLALADGDARPSAGGDAEALPARARGEALRIADELGRTAHECRGGSVRWTAPQASAGGAVRFAVTDLSLGQGGAGIALFLAGCARAAGRAGDGELARRALLPLLHALRSPGARRVLRARTGPGVVVGVAGMAYALLHAARLLDDAELLRGARRAAETLVPRPGGPAEVHGGDAGAVLVLLALHRQWGDADLLRRAEAFGRALLRTSPPAEAGFAHGAAGVAHALGALHGATGDSGWHAGAARFPAPVRAFAARTAKPDEPAWRPSSWCAGAAGVALTLAAAAPGDEAAWALRERLLASLTAGSISPLDSLCCGAAGGVDALVTAAELLDRPELARAAGTRAAELLRRAERRGGFALGVPDRCAPTLMQGTAGIGHALLRLHDPRALPALLLWE